MPLNNRGLDMTTVRIRISAAISHEYDVRCPDFLPLDKLREGACELTLDEARAVLADAEYNSDPQAQDVGPYGMPLGTFNAYRALAKQIRTALEKAARGSHCC
jgi:hypothetical protein